MPAFIRIDNESTADRYFVALSFIIEGRAVAFPGFCLALCDGTLRLDVDYFGHVPDDVNAEHLITCALDNFEALLATKSEYRAALSSYPRNVALVWSDAKSDVEVAKVVGTKIVWHSGPPSNT